RTPTIQQLQAVVDNSNPLQQSTGNPDLKQQTEHRLMLNYAASNPDRGTFFLSMLTLNLANDYIGSNTIYASDSTVYQGIPLPAGSRLVVPENLDGYYTFGSFLTYAFPVSPLKSNLNFNIFANYSNTPGLISGIENVSNNFNYGLHLVLASNISERLDFTLTSKSTWYQIGNTLNTNPNSTYSTLNTSGKLEWTIGPGITTHANLEYQTYNGFSVAGENALVLLNMGLGKKLFADDRGEIQFAVYDVLGQNSNISQTTTGNYIEENRTLALTRYYLLSFTYRIKNFRT
ncbi:MAG: outer membrane beta-barrel protein, partial [Candidatus Neomarinimicrobiota bacterium]